MTRLFTRLTITFFACVLAPFDRQTQVGLRELCGLDEKYAESVQAC